MSRVRRVFVLSLSLLGFDSCVVGGASQPVESPGTYGSPPGGPGTIHVVAATYGASCGQPRGNVTAQLSALCEGQDQRCPYTVDYRVIGDPAYGCQKDYFAEWTCGSAPEVFQAALPPEAGFGAVVELSCPPAGPAAPNAPAAPPPMASPPDVAPPPPVPSLAPPPPPPIWAPPAVPPVGAPSPPPAGTAAIHVVAGSYGLNCRAARGNTTAHLYRSCEGQPECAYRVDYRAIGDPAYGCRKDYFAEWTCTGDPTVRRAGAPPEAGLGAVVTLSCRTPTVATPPPPPPSPAPPPAFPRRHPRFGGLAPAPPPALIHVVAGSYGMNCRAAHGNATPHLHQICDGRADCAYRIDYKVIGDPAYGCQKDYLAEWTCGADPQIHRAVAPPEAGLGSVVPLSCR